MHLDTATGQCAGLRAGPSENNIRKYFQIFHHKGGLLRPKSYPEDIKKVKNFQFFFRQGEKWNKKMAVEVISLQVVLLDMV